MSSLTSYKELIKWNRQARRLGVLEEERKKFIEYQSLEWGKLTMHDILAACGKRERYDLPCLDHDVRLMDSWCKEQLSMTPTEFELMEKCQQGLDALSWPMMYYMARAAKHNKGELNERANAINRNG